MLTDELPTVWHDDDYIREWARNHGLARLPVAYVALGGAVVDTGPIRPQARIEFCLPSEPVIRTPDKTSPSTGD